MSHAYFLVYIADNMDDSVQFYTDAHISRDIVRQLRGAGADIVRCQDVGLENVSDEEHLIYAAEHGRVVITCDEDFSDLHWEWFSTGRNHAGIIYCRQPGNCTPGIIVQNAQLVFQDMTREEMANRLWAA